MLERGPDFSLEKDMPSFHWRDNDRHTSHHEYVNILRLKIKGLMILLWREVQ